MVTLVQRIVLAVVGVIAFWLPWQYHFEGLLINFLAGFASGVVGGLALRIAIRGK